MCNWPHIRPHPSENGKIRRTARVFVQFPASRQAAEEISYFRKKRSTQKRTTSSHHTVAVCRLAAIAQSVCPAPGRPTENRPNRTDTTDTHAEVPQTNNAHALIKYDVTRCSYSPPRAATVARVVSGDEYECINHHRCPYSPVARPSHQGPSHLLRFVGGV